MPLEMRVLADSLFNDTPRGILYSLINAARIEVTGVAIRLAQFAVMGSFFMWLVRQQKLAVNPLASVQKISAKEGRGYRRALSVQEIEKLLSAVPTRRATVYLMAMYTGLRRHELNELLWGDFHLDGPELFVLLPDTVTKNSKRARMGIRPELAAALRQMRPTEAGPGDLALFGKVPNMDTYYRDLTAAGIPGVDTEGRRMDFHVLRKTFGTLLQSSGASSPRR
jgi:integrase